MNGNFVLAPLFSKIVILIISYSAAIAALTYYIGFIFVQGSIMAFTNITNIWNIGFEFVPVSNSLYLVNGISYLHQRLPEIIIGGTCLLSYYVILYFPRSTNTGPFYRGIDKLRSYKFLNYLTKLIIVIILPLISLSLYGMNSSPKFVGYLNSLVIATLLISLLIFNNEYHKIGTLHFTKLVVCLFLIISLVINLLLLTVHVFIQGNLAQQNRLNAVFSEGTERGSLTLVYGEKSMDYYISIDLSSDYFIGYNMVSKNIDKIPKDKIKKIETSTVTKFKEVKKFMPDGNITKEVKDKTELVKNFYEYGALGKKDSIRWLALLSDEYYEGQIGLVSPDLLKKEWSILDTHYGLPKNEFIGIEMSIPEENTIWVKERWKNQFFFTVFKLKQVGNDWKIAEIREKSQPFLFVKG
ncbi:hypothetical protein [Brevibacillus porteri]|uniref:hypothetical protein n=1 Tax=Brevibacillus porteri TaxID=2126350 RepID=UPI003D1EC0B2